MAKKRYAAEEIIGHLRTIEIEAGKGTSIPDAGRKLGITEQTYFGQGHLEGGSGGKLLSPARRREAVIQVRAALRVSEHRACHVVGQCRATKQYVAQRADDEPALRAGIGALARRYGRYGYRRITALLRQEGWLVNHKRFKRIWREEGLKVPTKQPKRALPWLAIGSYVRQRPAYPNYVRSYDFVMDRTEDGRPVKLLTVLDEYTRECLAIGVQRRLTSQNVREVLSELFLVHGCPTYIRSDNGPEFIARSLRSWYRHVAIAPLFVEPGSPWESGYLESFNGKLRDELVNGELFYTLREAQIIIEWWRRHYNAVRPHGALGYRPPLQRQCSSNREVSRLD